uniref:Uncharacterized protein n=1 Tax=Arundo donax TaxID=35708 RepID=A0A0A9BQR3_ARUDO
MIFCKYFSRQICAYDFLVSKLNIFKAIDSQSFESFTRTLSKTSSICEGASNMIH